MPAQILLKPLLNELLDLVSGLLLPNQKDSRCCRLAALDAFGVAVGDLGEFPGLFQVAIGHIPLD